MSKRIKVAAAIVMALLLAAGGAAVITRSLLKASDEGDADYGLTEATEEQVTEIEIPTEEDETESSEEIQESETGDSEDAESSDESEEVIEAGKSVQVTTDIDPEEKLHFGDSVTLTAALTGFEGVDYSLQWCYSEDGETWVEVEGANALSYTYEITEENYLYNWTVVVNY